MSRMQTDCRQCGAGAAMHLGGIPPGEHFAGQPMGQGWDAGSLYQCRHCALGFRAPVRTEAEYEALYASASDQVWVSPALRRDQCLVRDRVHGHGSGGRVLDVGCYDGSLLAALGPEWQKFGLEASVQAAKAASDRGVTIVASRIRDLAGLEQRFDVITAVDVIEHVLDPRAFLAMLAERLLPGGLIVLSTGNLTAPAWRWAGAAYWYCTIPEHLSFISPAWAEQAARVVGLGRPEVQRFSYRDLDPGERWRARLRFIKGAGAARLKLWLAGLMPGLLADRVKPYSFGYPGLFEDHMVISLRKPARAPGTAV